MTSFNPQIKGTGISNTQQIFKTPLNQKDIKNKKVKEIGEQSLSKEHANLESLTSNHKTTVIDEEPSLDFLNDILSASGTNEILQMDASKSKKNQLKDEGSTTINVGTSNKEAAAKFKDDGKQEKFNALMDKIIADKKEFGAVRSEKELLRDLEVLTTRMNSRTEVLKHTQVFHFEEGGVALRMTSLMTARPEVMDLARENPRMMAQVVNGRVFVHPDSGFRAGSFIQVLDDNEEPQVLLVEFFKPEQLRRMEFICLNFMNDQVESKLEKNEAGRGDAPRVQRDEGGKEVKGADDKRVVAEAVKKEPVVAKQFQREEQHRDEDAALLRGAKKKDQQAMEKQDGVVRKETIKTEENRGKS